MTNTNPELDSTSGLTKEPVSSPAAKVSDKFVKYVGSATRRIIETKHWATVGVPNMPTTEWTVQNEYKIPVSDFPVEALAYLKRDGRFQVTD